MKQNLLRICCETKILLKYKDNVVMNNIKKRLGRRIQELRKSNKLTQEQLAEKIEIATSNISYIETGKFYPTPETLGKIAKALNVEIYELYMFEQLKPIDELRTELIGAIRANDDLTRLMYKFYLSVK